MRRKNSLDQHTEPTQQPRQFLSKPRHQFDSHRGVDAGLALRYLTLVLPLIVDVVALGVSLVGPSVLVLYFRWKGVVVGALLMWGAMHVAGMLLSSIDPNRELRMLDSAWALLGWVPGLLYSILVLAVRGIILRVFRN